MFHNTFAINKEWAIVCCFRDIQTRNFQFVSRIRSKVRFIIHNLTNTVWTHNGLTLNNPKQLGGLGILNPVLIFWIWY